MFGKMPEKIKEFIKEQEKEHTPEKLMEKAAVAIEEIIPEEMHSIFFVPKEEDTAVSVGSALWGGGKLFAPAERDTMEILLNCALELTCQAIVAEKWKEAEQ